MLKMKNGLSFSEILEYFGGGSRCLDEGDEVLKARHIICCGYTEKKEEFLRFFALCLQTSGVSSFLPHHVEGTLDFLTISCSSKKINIICSCKAGKSEKCKHCAAVLLHINRFGMECLEDLSSTDTQKQWGKLKADALNLYTAKPNYELCYVKIRPEQKYKIPPAVHSAFLKAVCAACPNSAIAKHRVGRVPLASVEPASSLNPNSYRIDTNASIPMR